MKKIPIKKILIPLLIFGLSFAYYGQTLKHDFNLDDDYIINAVPDSVTNLTELVSMVFGQFDGVDYRPVAMLTFSQQSWSHPDYLITPFRAHRANIMYFALCALSLLFMLRRLTVRLEERHGIRTHWLVPLGAVLIFLAHPVHANVVSSMKNRDAMLSLLFAALAFNYFLQVLQTRKRRHYFMCFLCFVLAVYSKLDAIWMVMVFPAYFLLFEDRPSRKFVFRSGLLFALLYFGLIVFRFVLPSTYVEFEQVAEPIIFTENPMVGTGLPGKIYYTFLTFFYYVKFMIIPTGYVFFYGYHTTPAISPWHPYFLAGVVLFAGGLTFAWRRYRQRDFLVVFAVLFFYLALVYCLNFLRPVSGIFAPRLAFTASAGFCLLAAIGIWRWAGHFYLQMPLAWLRHSRERTYLTAIGLLMLVYLPFTLGRSADWKDFDTLLNADMPNIPESFQAHRIASAWYLRQAGDLKDLNPDKHAAEIREYAEKGLSYSLKGSRIDPESIFTQEGIGIAYHLLGRYDEAIRHFEFVSEKFKDSEVAWNLRGDIFMEREDFAKAAYCYEQTLRISPDYVEAYDKFTHAMVSAGLVPQAIRFYEEMTARYGQQYVFENNLLYLQGLQ